MNSDPAGMRFPKVIGTQEKWDPGKVKIQENLGL